MVGGILNVAYSVDKYRKVLWENKTDEGGNGLLLPGMQYKGGV